jgi:putative spermidine/putrescine transport system permease protein
LTEAIAEAYLLDFMEAERVTHALTNEGAVTCTDVLGLSHTFSAEAIRQAVRPALDHLVNQVAENIVALNGKPPAAAILIGGGSLFPGVAPLMALALGLLLFPMVLVVVASFNDVPQATVAGFRGFTLRWYAMVLDNERYLEALLISAQLAAATVLVALLLTVPAAFALARQRLWRPELVVALLMLPLALPGIAKAVGMLKLLQWFNQIPPFLGLLLVHVVMVAPFMLAMLRASVGALDRSLEEASQGLGGRPVTTWWRVILPQLAPGLVAAGVIGFLISFGEVTVTAFLVTAQTQTLPVRIYAEATLSLEITVIAVSTLFIAATVLVLALLGRFVRLDHAWRR